MKIQEKRLKNILDQQSVWDIFYIDEKNKKVIFKSFGCDGEVLLKKNAYLTSRGWIFAEWSNQNNNYRCTFHINDTPQNFCYCLAQSLEGLANDYTVKKFRSIYDAARAICND